MATKRQREKKNVNRPKAGEIGYVSFMHRPRKSAIIKEENKNQLKLL